MLDIAATHRCWMSHLGDQWASINCLLHLSAQHGKPARISRWTYTDLALHGWFDLKPTLSTILACLDAPGSVEIVDEKPTLDLWAPDVWNSGRYFSTKMRWTQANADESDYLSYQFDGNYNGHLNNPPQEHIDLFLQKFPFAVRLGLPLDLYSIVTYLAHSRAAFCIDSGISHVARSVGTPLFLIRNRGDLDVTHKHAVCTRCADIPDALARFQAQHLSGA
jgi:hypothetical protein